MAHIHDNNNDASHMTNPADPEMEPSVNPTDAVLLIVDDDEPFRNRLGRALEKRGFQPILAAGVTDASVILRNTAPAYAVVDLRLEDGDTG